MTEDNCCFCNYNHCTYTFVAVKYNGTIKSLSDITDKKINQLSACLPCAKFNVKNINNMCYFLDPLGNYYDSEKPELNIYYRTQKSFILN